MLEILLVLGIAAALIIAAFVIYPKVQASRRTLQETHNISQLAASINDLYGSTGDYSNISNTVLLNAGVFPSSMVAANGLTVTNVWGGKVTVTKSPWLSRGFEIVEDGVPTAECNQFTSAAEADFEVVRVNGWFPKNSGQAFSISNTMQQPCNDLPSGGEIAFDRH